MATGLSLPDIVPAGTSGGSSAGSWCRMRRLSRAEMEARLLEALRAAPTACVPELIPELYPELLEEVRATLLRLEADGKVHLFYRRWHVR